jgi:transcription initiation factor TFIIB
VSIVRTAAAIAPDTEVCPECSTPTRADGIDLVCPECGLVTATRPTDHGPPWSFHDDDRHTGPPRTITRHDRGLGTQIGHDDADRRLPFRQRQQHTRARMATKADRGRAYAHGELKRLTDRLDLPGVVRSTAGQLFEQAQDAGLAQGREYDALTAASLIAAARIHGAAVTFDAVDDVRRTAPDADTPQGESVGLYRMYQALVETLAVPVPPPDPAGLVGAIVRECELDASVQTDAEALAREYADELVGAGRNPKGVAAAAVYLSAGGLRNGEVTQHKVGEAAGVTPGTIRKVASLMEGEDG